MSSVNDLAVTGVDGWRRGWVAVTLRGGAFHEALTAATFAELLVKLRESTVIAVDIPIGLPDGPEPRAADLAARRLLGRRGPTVFLTPPREVLEAPTLKEAIRISRATAGTGISAQAYALRTRILEVDEHVGDPRILEVHPEISFRTMAGHPIGTKKSWEGQMLRRELLTRHGVRLPDRLGDAGAAPADDILDAAAAAWSAHRFASGSASSLPPGRSPAGPPIRQAIWY
jgi:predicted RNase H-like nuclease